MTVVAAETDVKTVYLEPVAIDEFRILGAAETYDVIVTPDDDYRAYTIFAQSMDR